MKIQKPGPGVGQTQGGKSSNDAGGGCGNGEAQKYLKSGSIPNHQKGNASKVEHDLRSGAPGKMK